MSLTVTLLAHHLSANCFSNEANACALVSK